MSNEVPPTLCMPPWCRQDNFISFSTTHYWKTTRNFEVIKPITHKEGTRENRTCPEPLGVKIPKNSPFQCLKQWQLWKESDICEGHSGQTHFILVGKS
jgi:hypothetical protein